jgi:aminoglycoside phosphotransferase (APT) family kinase protein
MSDMEKRIEAYLAHVMPSASAIAVNELSRIQGGSSQETYRLRARWTQDGEDVDKPLILRREPAAGLVVAERDLEYSVYRALEGQGVPVPGVHFLELEGAWLDRPFFIMDLAPGKPGHFYAAGDPYEGRGEDVGRQFWRHLGRLAAVDHRAVGLERLRNGQAMNGFWWRELGHWQTMLDTAGGAIDPVVRGAIRWLRRNPPPEATKPAIVHGDYRSGNFLFTDTGEISAILDWEMCHIGDPLEDVAWAINAMWPMTRHLPLDEGLACWEETSGMTADRAALDWWRLFAPVKALGIWATAGASIRNGTSREMVVAMTAIRGAWFHRNEILQIMETKGAMG